MGCPTWATGGDRGIYGWPLPVVIAGSLVSTLRDHGASSLKISLSLILIVTSIGKEIIKMTTD